MALSTKVEERDWRARPADAGHKALPFGDTLNVLGPAASNLAKLGLAAIDAGHTTDPRLALQVERIWADASQFVGLKHIAHGPPQNRPVVKQASANNLESADAGTGAL